MEPGQKEIFLQQYSMIRDARSALFDYCDTIKSRHFLQEVQGFGRGGSIRNLLVHVVNTYQFWIGYHCFGRDMDYTAYESVMDMHQCREIYRDADRLVQELVDGFDQRYDQNILRRSKDRINELSPFRVFVHVTTHEFHHKGQILSISRHLDYLPADTDVIR